jgi:hypothetical protein
MVPIIALSLLKVGFDFLKCSKVKGDMPNETDMPNGTLFPRTLPWIRILKTHSCFSFSHMPPLVFLSLLEMEVKEYIKTKSSINHVPISFLQVNSWIRGRLDSLPLFPLDRILSGITASGLARKSGFYLIRAG